MACTHRRTRCKFATGLTFGKDDSSHHGLSRRSAAAHSWVGAGRSGQRTEAGLGKSLRTTLDGVLRSRPELSAIHLRGQRLNSNTNDGSANTDGANTDVDNRHNHRGPNNSPLGNSQAHSTDQRSKRNRKTRVLGSGLGTRQTNPPSTVEELASQGRALHPRSETTFSYFKVSNRDIRRNFRRKYLIFCYSFRRVPALVDIRCTDSLLDAEFERT
jgi:hypothetical protein